MSRISYINGRYAIKKNAEISIEDRGFLLADGVYEVIGVINGHFIDERGHLNRLERSMSEVSLAPPVSMDSLRFISRELLRKNRLKSAAIYIQITRGIAKRDFKFPDNVKSSLVMMCWPFNFDSNPHIQKGVRAYSVPDQRWSRRDIKTIALLPQVLAKQKAAVQGGYEAIMVDSEGYITEGASSNFWIYKDGALITRHADFGILKGVTRTAILSIAKEQGIKIEERAFTLDEAYNAQEAFCTSATALCVPVIELDENIIGDGVPGKIAGKIYQQYRLYAQSHYNDQNEWFYE